MKDEEFREKIAEIKRIQEANDLTIKNTAEDIQQQHDEIKRQHDEIKRVHDEIMKTHDRIVGKKTMGIIEDLASKIAQLEVAVQTNAMVIAAETTRAETAEKQVEHAIQRADARSIVDVQQARMDLTDEISFVKGRILDHLALFEQFQAKLDNKADLVNGKVPSLQLPALALTNVTVVEDIAARDALTGMDEGDVAVVGNDGGVRSTYIYNGTEWHAMSSPADVTEAELAAAVSAGLSSVNERIDGLRAGAGMTRTGDTFNVVGTADRIKVNESNVDIDPDYKGQKSIIITGINHEKA